MIMSMFELHLNIDDDLPSFEATHWPSSCVASSFTASEHEHLRPFLH